MFIVFLFFQKPFLEQAISIITAVICCGGPLLLFAGAFALFIIEVNKNSRLKWEKKQQQMAELQQAKDDYFKSLEELKSNPTDANLKQQTLELGRKYSALTRQLQSGDKNITVYDEVALMNDINASCAGAMNVSSTNFQTVEERLAQLSDLKNKGLISEDEYEVKRQKLLDEI